MRGPDLPEPRRTVARLTLIVSLLLSTLLLSSPFNAYADQSAKDRLLAKAREQLIAKLKPTQPQLAEYLEKIDAKKWGEYAGEISAGNGQAVLEKILAEKKDEVMAELYKKGKEHAISKGVLGADTKTYVEWAEAYGGDAADIAQKTYNGEYRGAGDILLKRMKEEALKQQPGLAPILTPKDYLSGVVADGIDWILKDLVGSSVGKGYLKILELELAKIEEFKQYTEAYFGRFDVTRPDGTKDRLNLCTHYAYMRGVLHHDPDFSFDQYDAGSGVTLPISSIITLPGFFYSTGTPRPDELTVRKQLELCYIQSKVPDQAALRKLIDNRRAALDERLFGSIREGMLERKRFIITIIEQIKVPQRFSLVVHVAAEDTGNDISGSTVVMAGEKQDAATGVAVYSRDVAMLDPDKSGESIDITAEAKNYTSKTASFTIASLANRFDADKVEVQIRVTLHPIPTTTAASEDFTIEVTVADKQTGDKISGAKTTFDGETRDAPSGVAAFTRKSSLLDPDKSGTTLALSAEGSGYKPGTDSYTAGGLAAKLDKASHRVALTISLEKVTETAVKDFTIDVTVTDKKTGATISGSKTTFDGETRDAPTGVASFTRKSSMLDPANSRNNVSLSAEASRYKSATTSYTIGRLATDLDKDKNRIALVISLTPEDTVDDEIAGFAVQCGPRDIFENEASICRAELTYKSGKTKGVSGESKWTPQFVETSKGTVRGQEASAGNPLPYTVKPEATYEASAREGGKTWVASDTVLVKPAAGATDAAVKIRKVPSAQVVNPGDAVIYSITVTNTGKSQLDRVRVVDEKCAPVRYVRGGTNFSSGILDPNETWEFECRTVLQTTTQNTAVVEAWSVAAASLKVTDQATVTVTVQPKPTVTATLRVSVRDQGTRQEIPGAKVGLIPAAGSTTQTGTSIRFEDVPFGTYDVTATADGYSSGREPVTLAQPQDYLVVIWLSKTPEEVPPTPALIARLECGGLVEVIPGEVSKPCGVIVEGWRSNTTDRVEVVFSPSPPPGGIQIFPGDTAVDATNMHNPGVKVDAIDRYTFFEGFSAVSGAAAGQASFTVTVRQGATQVALPLTVVVVPKGLPSPTAKGPTTGGPGTASGSSGQLTARLECGGMLELVPGEVSKSCGVVVEGWRGNTTDPVEVEVVWPRQASGVEVFPGSTRSEPGSMFNPGVKTSGVDRYVFSEGFSARDNAPPGPTNVSIRVRQRGAGEIELGLTAVVVSKSGKPTGPMGPTGTGVSSGASGRLSAELDCGDSFEIAPGDVVGRTCGIVVRGWRSDSATPVEVEVVWPQASSGVTVSPGSTAADATVMYSAGVSDKSDQYVFTEGFTARPDAPPGTTTVNITVRQRDVGSVALRVNVDVLRKGLLPSSGPGIRPPPTVAGGTGGQFCVWRYKLFGDKPACFHFVAADCTTARYNNAANSYEKVGDNMKWSEADARVQQLSMFFDNNYGCNVASTTPPPTPPQPTTPGPETPPEQKPPDVTPPVAGTDPPAPTGPYLSRFGVMCTPAQVTLGDSPATTPSVQCRAFGVYSDKPDTTLEVTNRAAWSQGPSFTPDAAGAVVIQASLEGASESATVTVTPGYDASKDPRGGSTGHAGSPILPPNAPPGGPQQDPNKPPTGLGGGPVVQLTPPDSKNPNPGGTGPGSGPGSGPGVPPGPGVPGQPQPCWNQQLQRWDYCPPQAGVGSQPVPPNDPTGGRGGNRGTPGGTSNKPGTGSTGGGATGGGTNTGTPPTMPGGTGTKPATPPTVPPQSPPPPTTTQPPTPPPPKAPPSPLPPTAAAAGAKCDNPICREMCVVNCNFNNTIGFVASCADTCKPMNACPKQSYKLDEVKAACYDNILTRCRQGQAGWGGDWCVGPGADKTCEARATQICKCGDKPACRGNWGSSLDGTSRFAHDVDVTSDVACTVPQHDQDEVPNEDSGGLVGAVASSLMFAQHVVD